VGLYGVLAYTVAQRTHEIGIRLALGAQPRAVVGMIVGQSLRVAVSASVAGIVVSLLLGRSLRSLLFEVRPRDPMTLAAAVGVLLLTAFGASYLPVRRALARNPLESLRAE
jgi:putative ABC transport system permease protein